MRIESPHKTSPSRWGWAFLLLALTTAVLLRFWQLGELPPGLYRDEAFNGLDALRVLDGQTPLFFTANNGREPAYIYLTALAVAFFGRTALAVRLAAAVVGSVTTLAVYGLATSWFDRRVGVVTAVLWAITLWPVHLSRIGLRPILLPLLLAITFWLGIKAYRRGRRWLWLLAGLAYGLSFYTYLAVRFTPLLLLFFVLFLWWRGQLARLWPGVMWFGLGALLTLLPLLLWLGQHPDYLLGRTNQVSILNPTINGGNLLAALWRQTGRGLGMFVWQGDDILRHNPAGRPVFDWLMALPFLIGVGWCVRYWKRPSAMLLLLWTAVMLGPTILAEDTPHFLRAVGVLPAALIFPALGLVQVVMWLRRWFAGGWWLVAGLLVGTLFLTVRDYWEYAQQPEVALLFETAAYELGQQIAAEPDGTAVYLDRWFWDETSEKGWPSVPFVADLSDVALYRPEFGAAPAAAGQSVAIYAWEFGALDFVPTLIQPPGVVVAGRGALAKGDLEAEPYPLFVRYATRPLPTQWPTAVNFDNQFWLRQADVSWQSANELQVDLYWEAQTAVAEPWIVFVQVVNGTAVVAQDDALPADGLVRTDWWQPGLVVQDRHVLLLPDDFDPAQHQLLVGLYDLNTLTQRLPVLDADGMPVLDSITLPLPDRQ